MTKETPCPCGGPAGFAACCEPLIQGTARATTAVQLMKSRYSAYSQGEIEYLMKTIPPEKRTPDERERLDKAVPRMTWLGLQILDTVEGGPTDSTGIVEFEATCSTASGTRVLRERSRFERTDGTWYYVDGDYLEPTRPGTAAPGRNDPCSCGSGKKFKKCCGK